MRQTIACVSMLVALVTFMIDCQSVSAQTVVIPHTDRGWYAETGFHNPSNSNYVVGDWRTFLFAPADSRNFFVFDLSSITQPIASAKLALSVLSSLGGAGYNSVDPSENYELHDVTTSIATLLNGTGGVAAHTDTSYAVARGRSCAKD
ncbi:MAG: hypothetical protein H0T51_25315 [Pirellulales bacterium]|nr:hypothetical protein [Pirellulales bacterium]